MRVPVWHCALFLSAVLASSALLAANAEDVVKVAGERMDRPALERGEVVWIPLGDREVSERDLSALLVVRLSAPLPKVMATLQDDPDLQIGRSVAIAGDESWREIEALLKESLDDKELDRLRDEDAASHFNLSTDELHQLRASGVKSANDVARAWAQVLKARVDTYRAGGMKALKPYQQPGEPDVHPGRDLTSSAESMLFLREHYPSILQGVMEYPTHPITLQQQFLFSKESEEGRPLYSLKHRMLEQTEQHALIFERSFYISHSLDSLDVAILCLPTEKGSQLAMLTHTFTRKVAGMGQAIAHRIGRMKVKEQTLPMFETLRDKFPLQGAVR